MNTRDFCNKVVSELQKNWSNSYAKFIMRKGDVRGQYIIENVKLGRTMAITWDHTENTYDYGQTSLFECYCCRDNKSIDLWSDDIRTAASRIWHVLMGYWY